MNMIETEKCNDTPMFLGSVDASADPWYADVTMRNHKIRFKIDTGADVSVIPAQMYYCINPIRLSYVNWTGQNTRWSSTRCIRNMQRNIV